MADIASLTAVECNVESQGGLTITVGEKKNLVCKIPATTASFGASAANGSATPDNGATAAGKNIEFSNADIAHPYDVQFIGAPAINGAAITQAFTSYKVGFKDITSARLKLDGREFAISPFRFEVKTVIAKSDMPPAAAGRDQEGTDPQQQTQPNTAQQSAELKAFPVVGPEGVAAPWWWWAIWIALTLIVIGYVARALIKYKKNKKRRDEVQATILTPQQKFQQKMRKLESQGYHLQSKYKSFALELTAIIKSTVGETLKFAAEDMTTEELLETLEKKHRTFYKAAGQTVQAMMAELDQIKFAKTETSPDRCLMLLDDANKIGRGLFGGAL